MTRTDNPDAAGAHPTRGAFRFFDNLLMHFRPVQVPERTLRFSLTWGLGGAATVLVLLLFATGLMLKFVFEPFPDRAYDSILYIEAQVPFGQLLRSLHRWSGNLLLLTGFLHLLRVYYTGAIDRPRRGNWLIGLGLFALAIMANFTGYLLPWDQVAFWAITISSSMLDYLPVVGAGLKGWVLGGAEPGPNTLMNFYVLHTAVFPGLLIAMLPFHFWRIRKAHGLAVPRRPEEPPGSAVEMVDVMPHLLVREVSAALVLVAALLLFSMVVAAPLGEPANPGLSPNPTKAPWYFMGLQELLLHFHPTYSVFVIPAVLLSALVCLPWLQRDPARSGVWFLSRTGRKVALVSAVLGATATIGLVLMDEAWRAASSAGVTGPLGRGLLPVAVIGLSFGLYALLLKKVLDADRGEVLQALFTVVISALVVLTIIGVWFRGAGMQLEWVG